MLVFGGWTGVLIDAAATPSTARHQLDASFDQLAAPFAGSKSRI
jgi:hypothetical protein